MNTTCTVCELHAESTFKIEGMDCREEVAVLERRFKNLVGLERFSADLMGQRLHVQYDAAKLTASAIADAVADTGMRAWLEHEEPVVVSDRQVRIRQGLMLASGVMLAAGFALELFGSRFAPLSGAVTLPSPVETGHDAANSLAGWAIAAFVLSLAAGVSVTARKAWSALRVGSLDINVLMLVAAAGAVLLGQWSEAATVVFLFALAQALEARTLDRARSAIRALMDLTPSEALVREGAGERRVDVERVAPGTTIVVRPGEKIPLDGQVLAGESAVNQAPVTGESLPVEKQPGDEVFAGTINGRGALDVRVTRLRRDTTLARIIHLVERAQAQRAPAQALVERFARVYTPAVMVLAAAVAIVPPLVFHLSWHESIYRGLVLLVVSCPCALVISTPVSIVAALAGAARKGVLIKGGVHLERTSGVQCVAFDKTGTLTRGVLEVVRVVPLNGESIRSVVALASSVEQRSNHPIAHAIVGHASAAGIAAAPAEGVSSLAGRGTEGSVGAARVLLGNHRVFEERGICSTAIHRQLDELSVSGHTAVLVARDGQPIGIIALADRPRESARDAVELLRGLGVPAIVMLTGDSRPTATAIASDLGIDEFHAELLPEDKVAAVKELQRRYGSVAMVGDGVNDAPALATADVGIAMGVAGSDAALETADVALMADELLKIPYAFRLSRATVRNIRINLAISVVMKAAFVVAAVAGVATLWMAIVADTGASVIVIANALRLLRAD
ncbi:MAG TPA: heavy metal translocating P-type ATPase [Vicinamibacterales bacterium]|nr:heavy metal translocating P-type ATPase [Vicinamibacterales bacterium]